MRKKSANLHRSLISDYVYACKGLHKWAWPPPPFFFAPRFFYFVRCCTSALVSNFEDRPDDKTEILSFNIDTLNFCTLDCKFFPTNVTFYVNDVKVWYYSDVYNNDCNEKKVVIGNESNERHRDLHFAKEKASFKNTLNHKFTDPIRTRV